jgi:hypothetical protein
LFWYCCERPFLNRASPGKALPQVVPEVAGATVAPTR